ncbi:MAG: HAMP domain-containing histidine kinase [Clostridiales bacterium]|nr:HAMP domain-containing histidine kinase [Clostridiales bacterium]
MGVFRNKNVRNQFILSLFFLVFTGIIAFVFDRKAGIFVLLSGTGLCILQIVFAEKRYKEIRLLSQQLDEILHEGGSMELRHFREGDVEILRDELQKMLLRLEEQTELLEKEKMSLADSLADISHQIRTPLTTLNLLVERLKKNTGDISSRQSLLREAEQMLDRIQWLVTSLLRLSKLDAGAIVLKPQTILLSSFFREVMKPFDVSMDVRGQSLEIRGDGSTEVQGDYNWTMEAIGNVIKNSLEYTPEGGHLLIEWAENPLFTEIKITDSGKGIPKEDIPHLFERFYRGKNAGNHSFGIGLSLSRAILSQENAVIYGQNVSPLGAQFVIRFYKTVV